MFEGKNMNLTKSELVGRENAMQTRKKIILRILIELVKRILEFENCWTVNFSF